MIIDLAQPIIDVQTEVFCDFQMVAFFSCASIPLKH